VLNSLDQFDRFRRSGHTSARETGDWMHAFSEILTTPPRVGLLRLES
jgi:hypothetical protein